MSRKRKQFMQPAEKGQGGSSGVRRFRLPRWISTAGIVLALCLIALAVPSQRRPTLYTYKVVAKYAHDPAAFCQGLIFHDGALLESTGHYGHSTLRRVDLTTGTVKQQRQLAANLFGEGLARIDDKLLQLTWKSGRGFIYDATTFEQTGEFRYRNEGWGLTYDGQRLIMSDGTDTLRFLNPDTFEVEKTVAVRDGNARVRRLNELEYVKGEIFANIWYRDQIARISPKTGRVLGWIDLRGLLARKSRDDVLNGIAYDEANDRLFVTGKNWPALFEVDIVPARAR